MPRTTVLATRHRCGRGAHRRVIKYTYGCIPDSANRSYDIVYNHRRAPRRRADYTRHDGAALRGARAPRRMPRRPRPRGLARRARPLRIRSHCRSRKEAPNMIASPVWSGLGTESVLKGLARQIYLSQYGKVDFLRNVRIHAFSCSKQASSIHVIM